MFAAAVLLGVLAAVQMLLEGFNGLMNELAVGGGVPAEPEAGVAVEAVAVEERGLVSDLPFGFLLGWVCGGFHGPCYHVSQDFAVLQREDTGESENSGR